MIFSSGVVWQSRDLQLSRNTLYLLSPHLCFYIVLKCDLFVYRDNILTSKRVIMRAEQPTKCFVPVISETEGKVSPVRHV